MLAALVTASPSTGIFGSLCLSLSLWLALSYLLIFIVALITRPPWTVPSPSRRGLPVASFVLFCCLPLAVALSHCLAPTLAIRGLLSVADAQLALSHSLSLSCWQSLWPFLSKEQFKFAAVAQDSARADASRARSLSVVVVGAVSAHTLILVFTLAFKLEFVLVPHCGSGKYLSSVCSNCNSRQTVSKLVSQLGKELTPVGKLF